VHIYNTASPNKICQLQPCKYSIKSHDDHSRENPGKVRELQSGEGKVKEDGKSQETIINFACPRGQTHSI